MNTGRMILYAAAILATLAFEPSTGFVYELPVGDGKVVLWHWFEDSYAVSKAYHG